MLDSLFEFAGNVLGSRTVADLKELSLKSGANQIAASLRLDLKNSLNGRSDGENQTIDPPGAQGQLQYHVFTYRGVQKERNPAATNVVDAGDRSKRNALFGKTTNQKRGIIRHSL